jgi:WXXGXW repeat (2 copies)
MHYNDFARRVTRVVVLVVFAVMINANQSVIAQLDSSSSNPVVTELLPAIPLEATKSVDANVPPIPAAGVDPNDAGDANAAASLDLGYSILMQGPVHEAFAAPIANDPSEGTRIHAVAPPQPIQEKPPANTQAGDGTIWISGYWAWSDEANKYVWVSGLYRKSPPGRIWVAGYWSESASGYRWTSGYWSRENASAEIAQPLPVPPASIDNGPSIPPPGEDYFWLPGQWEYAADQYQWRGGYWTTHHEGWVWQPACYMSTPAGFLYVDGYWDALPTQRGQLYVTRSSISPVTFTNPSIHWRRQRLCCCTCSRGLVVRITFMAIITGQTMLSLVIGLGMTGATDVVLN